MSLTATDLQSIRTTVTEAITDVLIQVINPRFDSIETRLDGIEIRLQQLENHAGSTEKRLSTVETELSLLNIQTATIAGRLEALENDVKELYKLIDHLPSPYFGSKAYQKLPDTRKIVVLNTEIGILAQKMGMQL